MRKRLDFELCMYIAIWYFSSVVCTNTTKTVNLHWALLTLTQLSLSALCGFLMIFVFGFIPYRPLTNFYQLRYTAFVSFWFVVGFVTLNESIRMMSISIVMTYRAAEPLFTMVLSFYLNKKEKLSWLKIVSLGPIIVGAILSSLSQKQATYRGILTVTLCNLSWALIRIYTRRLKQEYSLDACNFFFQISYLGACQQALVLLLLSPRINQLDEVSGHLHADAGFALHLLINGLTFFLYLQMSWLVLARVSAVTHSIINSLRLPFLCVFGWLQFGENLSSINMLGIALASVGAVPFFVIKDKR
ncbi:hypothetical protein GUITHDRAFT_117060 [Guillardia theta CCMP2712]|uniref:Sugar phosphate transporter domain-containing protein n=1 Tax=Guillardia theta (strain CCMP2712) TaxID=905079 RepID=L1ILV4_GUITC|nr:hypothetical protein GUITHDRAFT_117060 [Guillardia theta CCMP2712]EKX36765.1 hypothetical protein GUITHDRAFT_117060 [Guillardia theta CCMP2712]|eukprot:XP_005823745.1 hypothetical protein GUITHDRAFT_117060 [Guillardia theta CCMP2712]